MRDIPAPLQTHIAGEVLSLARCLVITKTNGTVVRLTTHDKRLRVNGDLYHAGIPIDISAIQSTSDLSVDNAEITLGFDEVLIKQKEFDKGLYDNAKFELFIVNWENIADGRIPLKRGTLGDIEITDKVSVKIQMRGLTHALTRPIVERYSPTCRVALGSPRCGMVNTPNKIRRARQKVKTFDWFLVPTANVTEHDSTNMGFESAALTGWTIPEGSTWSRASAVPPASGVYYAEGGAGVTGTEHTIYQEVTTAALGWSNGDVDDGDFSFDFEAQITLLSESFPNTGWVFIEQYDADGMTIRRDESEALTPDYATWQGIGVTTFINPGCRSIRYGCVNRIDKGSSGYVAFDVCKARWWTNVASTWGNRMFRTVRIPAYSAGENYAMLNMSFDAQASVGNTNDPGAITGWNLAGYWRTVASIGALVPSGGNYFLFGGDDGSTTPETEYAIYQQIPLSNGGQLASEAKPEDIANGWYYVELRGFVAKTDSNSSAKLTIGFYDSGNVLISNVTSDWIDLAVVDTWVAQSLGTAVPPGTSAIRLTFHARSGLGGSLANVGFDRFRLIFTPTAYEADEDAETGYLAAAEPDYDYTTNAYTKDGQAIVQARPSVFAYGSVTSVTSKRAFNASSINETAARFYSGKITWLSGANAGRTSYVRIWDNTAKSVKLYNELVDNITVGDKFIYAKGCDKTIDTCADVFGNAHNFRGEPYLPGPSKVIEFLATEAT